MSKNLQGYPKQVRISNELHKEIKHLSTEKGITISYLIESLLKESLSIGKKKIMEFLTPTNLRPITAKAVKMLGRRRLH